MAYENPSADYTEVDPNSRITTSTTAVTATDVRNNEDAYVYKSHGSAHFSGDFSFLCEVYTGAGNDSNGYIYGLGLANTVDDRSGCDPFLGFRCTDSGTTTAWFQLESESGATNNTDSSSTLSDDTLYYMTLERDETAGEAYLYIRTGSHAGTLQDTLTVSLAALTDFEYLYIFQSINAGPPTKWAGYVQNVDLQEAAGGADNARLLDGLLAGGQLVGGRLVR